MYRLRCVRSIPIVTLVLFSLVSSVAVAAEIPIEDSSSPVLQSKYELYGVNGEYTVSSVERGDGSLRIMVTDLEGITVFESFYPVWEHDGPHVAWRYREAEVMIARSARIRDSQLPTLGTMNAAAKDIVRIVKTQSHKRHEFESLDNWGCDIPEWTGWGHPDTSCSPEGNCCDQHDACYSAFGCTALSWSTAYVDPLCTLCNAAVIACLGFGVGDTGLPSECCEKGNCGEPRGTAAIREGGPRNLDPSEPTGSAGTWTSTSSGGIEYSNGVCCFATGQCVPCG